LTRHGHKNMSTVEHVATEPSKFDRTCCSAPQSMNEASDASRITQGLNLVGFFPGEFG